MWAGQKPGRAETGLGERTQRKEEEAGKGMAKTSITTTQTEGRRRKEGEEPWEEWKHTRQHEAGLPRLTRAQPDSLRAGGLQAWLQQQQQEEKASFLTEAAFPHHRKRQASCIPWRPKRGEGLLCCLCLLPSRPRGGREEEGGWEGGHQAGRGRRKERLRGGVRMAAEPLMPPLPGMSSILTYIIGPHGKEKKNYSIYSRQAGEVGGGQFRQWNSDSLP